MIHRWHLIALTALLAIAGALSWSIRPFFSSGTQNAELPKLPGSSPAAPAGNPSRSPANIPVDPEARELFERYISFLREGTFPDEDFMTGLVDWQSNPSQYREVVLALLDSDEGSFESRMNLITDLLLMMTNRHPLEALSLLDAMAPRLNTDGRISYHLTMLIDRAASKDPQFAADWLKDHAGRIDEKLFKDSTLILLSQAATSQPAVALSVLATLPEDQLNEGMIAIGRGIVTPQARAEIWQQIQQMTAGMNPDQAGSFRKAAIEGIANGLLGSHQTPGGVFMSEPSFSDSVSWIDSAGLTSLERETVAANLQPSMHAAEDGKWLDWIVENAGSESSRSQAMSTMMKDWALRHAEDAEQWLVSKDIGEPGVSAAISAFISATRDKNPDAAARVAGLLPEDQRATVLETIRTTAEAREAESRMRMKEGAKRMGDLLDAQENAMKDARAARESQNRR